MEMHRESIQMTDVERAEIGMKGIVQKGVIHGKVYRQLVFRSTRWSWLDFTSSLAWRLRLLLRRIRECSLRVWRRVIGSEVQAI
jgi:hypothetical protein